MFASPSFYVKAAVLSVLATAGCQASSVPGPQALATPQRTILVTTGNGGSLAVFLPPSDDNDVETSGSVGSHIIRYNVSTGNGGTQTVVVPSTDNNPAGSNIQVAP